MRIILSIAYMKHRHRIQLMKVHAVHPVNLFLYALIFANTLADVSIVEIFENK